MGGGLLAALRDLTLGACSHRPALIAFHDLKLELDGRGSYTLESITHSDNGPVTKLLAGTHEERSMHEALEAADAMPLAEPEEVLFASLPDPVDVRCLHACC